MPDHGLPRLDRGRTHRDGPARRPTMKKKQQEGGCLLGYNENMGARIYVKRQDDGSFHDRDALMKTLLHELCHNVVGPHNAVFLRSMRMRAGTSRSRARPRAVPWPMLRRRKPLRELPGGGQFALRRRARVAAFVANAVSCYPAPVVAPPPPPAVDAAEQRVASPPRPARLGVCAPVPRPRLLCAIRARRYGADTRPRRPWRSSPPSPPEPPAPGPDPDSRRWRQWASRLGRGGAQSDVKCLRRAERPLTLLRLHLRRRPARARSASSARRATRMRLNRPRRGRDVDDHPHERRKRRTFKRVRLGNKKFLRTAGKFAAAWAARGGGLRARELGRGRRVRAQTHGSGAALARAVGAR